MKSEVKQASLPNPNLNYNSDCDLCKACKNKYFSSIYKYLLNNECTKLSSLDIYQTNKNEEYNPPINNNAQGGLKGEKPNNDDPKKDYPQLQQYIPQP